MSCWLVSHPPPRAGTIQGTGQTPSSPCCLGEELKEIRVEEADGPVHGLVHPLVVLLP